jgi:hypothetical protein
VLGDERTSRSSISLPRRRRPAVGAPIRERSKPGKPKPGRPILVATDFGIRGEPVHDLGGTGWPAFVDRCAARDCPLLILVPWSRVYWPKEPRPAPAVGPLASGDQRRDAAPPARSSATAPRDELVAADPFEKRLVEGFSGPWLEVSPLVRLARLLSLATRIEPLLLRNSRRHFLPGSATEIESLFWFCPLIGARGNGEVVMHPGVSRLLADELRGEPTRFAEALAFTRRHTGHWLPEDRLEQELRLDTLSDDPASGQMRQGLQDMLRLVHEESDPERRIRLARSIRQTLATIGGAAGTLDELRWLNQYTSYSLGTMAAAPLGSTPLPPPPAWLAGTLPAPFRPARLAVELHYDAEENRPVLHFVAAADGAEAIDFPTPLPANLHVQCQGEPGNWHVVGLDKRVRLPMARTPVWLTTLAGRRYELRGDFPAASDDRGADPTAPQLYLSHFPEDREQALAIAGWLRQHGLRIELREEGGRAVEAAAASEGDDEPMRLLRLWTPAARERLAEQGVDAVVPLARAVLLRVDPTLEPPQAGYGADRLLDLPDLRTTTQAERTSAFLRQLHDWLSDAAPPEPPEPPPGDASSEVDRLLAELQDPQTLPPRRLAIGDRLAEIGDPRPGVGVREYVVRPAEAEQLLAEIAEPTTIPPRRLAIGDRLAEIGDPRRGVGLDSRGLPEIDWVEIPGGEFIYQDGERRTLPGLLHGALPGHQRPVPGVHRRWRLPQRKTEPVENGQQPLAG